MAGEQPKSGKPAEHWACNNAGNSLTSHKQSVNIALTTGGLGYG